MIFRIVSHIFVDLKLLLGVEGSDSHKKSSLMNTSHSQNYNFQIANSISLGTFSIWDSSFGRRLSLAKPAQHASWIPDYDLITEIFVQFQFIIENRK